MFKALAAVATVAVLASACGSPATGGSSSPDATGIDAKAKTVSIGAFVPETGPVPSYKLIAEGSKAYFDFINAKGGINGYKFTYKQVDDGYDPSRSLAAARQLVENDHVFALVAPIGTPTNAAVRPYAVQKALPVIGPIAGDPAMQKLSNYHALLPSYLNETKLVTTYAVTQLHKKRIAVLYENDDLGKPALKGAEQALSDLGMSLVASVAFNVSDTDLSAQITRAKQAGADATLVWGSNSNVATAVTTAKRIGFDTQFFAPFYSADPSTYQLAGSALDGTMFGSWLLPTSDNGQNVQNYLAGMKQYGRASDVGVFSLNGWTNAALFGTAFEQITKGGATPTRSALLKALSGFTKQPVGGAPEVTFTADDHNGTRSLSILKAGNDTFTSVTPQPIPFSGQ